MEIKLLHRDQIDTAKWDARVALSGNGLPYALSNYLDLVSDGKWNALVAGDYMSIFPLPYETKLGLKMYLQPPFTQQLGLISGNKIDALLLDFLKAIPKDYSTIFLKGNETDHISSHETISIKERSNYLLNLNGNYESIASNFSKSLRKRIRRGKELYDVVESSDVNMLVDFYQKEMQSRVGLNESQYVRARKLFEYLLDSKLGRIYLASNEDVIEGALLVVYYQNRIVNLFGTSNIEGKKHFAMHTILNHIIEANADQNSLLDFEGSDLTGVKEFYESFGPDRVRYPEFQIDNSPAWLKVAKKIKLLVSRKK